MEEERNGETGTRGGGGIIEKDRQGSLLFVLRCAIAMQA